MQGNSIIVAASTQTCKNCKHFRANIGQQVQRGGQATGACKRYPPEVVTALVPNPGYTPDPEVKDPRTKVPFGSQIIAAFPTMDGDDGCGEFQMKLA